MERYLSANDAARVLGVTAQAVHLMARRGELAVAGATESGIRLFRRADVERLATERADRKSRARGADPGAPAGEEERS